MDNELWAALAVIYKKLDKIERAQKGSSRFMSDEAYLQELKDLASKIK